jgi:enoyl-CoA hydratase
MEGAGVGDIISTAAGVPEVLSSPIKAEEEPQHPVAPPAAPSAVNTAPPILSCSCSLQVVGAAADSAAADSAGASGYSGGAATTSPVELWIFDKDKSVAKTDLENHKDLMLNIIDETHHYGDPQLQQDCSALVHMSDTQRWTQILYNVKDRVATITLNRPKYRNAISRSMSIQLDEAFAEACDDDAVRCIILTGTGPHFSSGHDLGTDSDLEGLSNRIIQRGSVPGRGSKRFADRFQFDVELCLKWRNLPKPVIAAVRGYCIYHAMALASCADVIFVSEDAMIMSAFTEYFQQPYDIGTRKTKELLFKGPQFINGLEAEKLGMVNHAVPDEELEVAVMDYVQQVVKQSAFGLRMMKQTANQMEDQQGFASFVRTALSHWVLLVDDMPPRQATSKSIIPKSQKKKAQSKASSAKSRL